MNQTIANALIGYFETLYDFNRNLIKLCGVDIIDNSGQYERIVNDIVQAVPRLVPYSYDIKNGEYIINDKDGLLEFSCDLEFLKEGYDSILQHHYDFLSKVKSIRNKIEHKMHCAKLVEGGSMSGSVAFDLTYSIYEEKITFFAREIIRFAKEINYLFSRIQKLVTKYAEDNCKENHRYYRRLVRYDFCDFNTIYDSDVLLAVGKFLYAF